MLVVRRASCCVANAFSTRLKLIWPIFSLKISKMSKKGVFGQKNPGGKGSNSSATVCIVPMVFLLKVAKLYYIQNRNQDCLAKCRDVCERATHLNSGNWPFLLTRAFYIISAVYRQTKEFDLANEYMEKSSEVKPLHTRATPSKKDGGR